MTGVEWLTVDEAATLLDLRLSDFLALAEREDWPCRIPGDGVRRYLRSVVAGHEVTR